MAHHCTPQPLWGPVERWCTAFRRPHGAPEPDALLAVLVSALYLVHTQYQSRRLFTELDRAVAEARRLDRSTSGCRWKTRAGHAAARGKMARAQLNMRTATPAITQYVSDPAGQGQQLPARRQKPGEGAR